MNCALRARMINQSTLVCNKAKDHCRPPQLFSICCAYLDCHRYHESYKDPVRVNIQCVSCLVRSFGVSGCILHNSICLRNFLSRNFRLSFPPDWDGGSRLWTWGRRSLPRGCARLRGFPRRRLNATGSFGTLNQCSKYILGNHDAGEVNHCLFIILDVTEGQGDQRWKCL